MSSFRSIELSDSRFESEGLRFLTVKTPNLQGRGDICVYVPEVPAGTNQLPIYILLHGVYGSAWAWALEGGAHRTISRLIQDKEIKPAILAMPSDGLWGDGSAYGAHHHRKFDQWIVHDVPLAVMENIPEAGENAPLCIGGLSMGGYGALMLGARFPERFKAISGHSAITKLEQMALFVEEPLEAYAKNIDLPDVIDAMQINRKKLPALRFDCGLKDQLLEPNRLLHRQLLESNIPHVYEEFPGGHEWRYWQEQVIKSFRFFDAATG